MKRKWKKKRGHRTHLFERNLTTLPYEARGFVIAMRWFEAEVLACRRLFPKSDTFLPVHNYLDNLVNALDEALDWLDRYVAEQDAPSTSDLINLLQYNTAEDLQEALDCLPELCCEYSNDESQCVEVLTDDIIRLTENVLVEIRSKGYQLHSVFIQADLPDSEASLVMEAYNARLGIKR